jgi:hypothetical protein
MTPRIPLVIYLVVHALSFVASCILGPLRGHSFAVSALGGFALGPLNLLLIAFLSPPARMCRCPACGIALPPGTRSCPRCVKNPG